MLAEVLQGFLTPKVGSWLGRRGWGAQRALVAFAALLAFERPVEAREAACPKTLAGRRWYQARLPSPSAQKSTSDTTGCSFVGLDFDG